MPVYTFMRTETRGRGRRITTKAKNISPLQTIMVLQYVGYVIKLRYFYRFIFTTYSNFFILRPKASLYPILLNVPLLNNQ